MTKKNVILFSFALYCLAGFAQVNNQTSAWTQNPYDRKIYIENNGQYNGIVNGDGVLFSVQMGKSDAYFTSHGVTYRCIETEPIKQGVDPDENGPPKRTTYFAGAEWIGCNPSVFVEGQDQQGYYCTYDVGNNQTVKAWPYKTMIYHNLYPGIDAEYTFHNNQPGDNSFGVEYSLIVHPGADLSQVKIQYSGVTGYNINQNGDLVWQSAFGKITDHAPVAYYQGEGETAVPVSYNVNGSEETFSVPDYDKTKTLVIDPWTTSPAFTTYNVAYEMDYDYAGNVYVYGGVGYELVKFNNAGVKQWMYTAATLASTGPYIGGMTTDKKSENTYLSEGWNSTGAGARCQKVNKNGGLVATNAGNANMNEIWRLRWDPCTHFVFGVGNGTCCADQACQLDTSMVTFTVANICAPTVTANGYHDFGSMDMDYLGGYCYTICSLSLVYTSVFNNYLVKFPIPGLVPATYQVPDHYRIHEFSSYNFNGSPTNGFSGVACSPNYTYLYQGDTIKQTNKATGAIIAVKQVTGTTSYEWGGVAADFCDNVYVGDSASLKEYNPAFALLSTWAMSGVIYDCKVNTTAGLAYACGNGFTSAVNNPAPSCVHSNACNVPLPIEMGPFQCQATQGTIVLTWSTATETNNKYFTVERSTDGINFLAIGTVQGAVNSSTTKYYSFTDLSPLNGTNYYRLSQTDMDGNTTNYSVTSCSISAESLGNIYPNPSPGKFAVSIDNTVSSVEIYNAIGQKIYEKTLAENSGSTLNVDLSSQQSGIYILNLIQTGSDKSIVKKIVVYPR